MASEMIEIRWHGRGGQGAKTAWLRAEVRKGLECLGAHLDPQRNTQCQPDADVAAHDSPTRILVIHTREDLMIARQCRRMMLEGAPGREAM